MEGEVGTNVLSVVKLVPMTSEPSVQLKYSGLQETDYDVISAAHTTKNSSVLNDIIIIIIFIYIYTVMFMNRDNVRPHEQRE